MDLYIEPHNTGVKVALVDLDGQAVPAGIGETLGREGIELLVRQCTSGAELAEYAGDADVVWLFGGSRILAGGNLARVRRCWAIVRTGSGTDNIPLDEATRAGIVVANTPTAFNDAVSDHVIALLFAAVRRIASADRTMRLGRWEPAGAQPTNVVRGSTLGLVGFGHIAREVARKLSGFGLEVLAHDPYVSADVMAAEGVKPAALNALLSQSDFISLHCPLTEQTRHLIGEEQFRLMKKTAVVINTARGPVVDEAALVRALAEGRIAAAGLDVFEQEPITADNPLLRFDNVVLTPHSAGFSTRGMELRWRLSLETLSALARGHWPPSCVNPTVQPRRPLSRPT